MVYTLVCHVTCKEEHIDDMRAFLKKASEIYTQDSETVGWHVMQSESEPHKFCIVERFEQESSQQEHLSNPFWKTFDPTVEPWMTKPIELLRFNEFGV
ncbi:hypothetical protein JCM10207_006763 [Rhodosporidiobolus poonsookiae]